ncbi:RRM5 [Auxenochlorella protothecoides x Auxenochlorella symbiontica]
MGSRVTRTGRVLEDVFFKKAKAAGYVARSAYKLLEIQEKHRIIPRGGQVLDLGCHPGAWLQVACQAIGPRSAGGAVLGIDLQETSKPGKWCDDRVVVVQGDARELTLDFWQEYAPTGMDVVLSDMCHFTHGNKMMDSYKSLELAQTAVDIAMSAGPGSNGILRPGGSLIMKLLQGPGTMEFAADMRPYFKKVAWQRPKATRSESKEVYLIGLKRHSPSDLSDSA